MNLRDYRPAYEIAKFPGLSPGTVAKRVRKGNLRSRRLPRNGYRLFRRSDMETFHREVKHQGGRSSNALRSSGRDRA